MVFLAVLALIAGVGVAIWRGTGPLPDPEQCSAVVGGRKVPLSSEQGRNAALIAAIGLQRRLPARAVSIALATAYQESKIQNLAHGDRDSIGIFQQRPSQGWGTVAQIRDEHYSINKFYAALEHIDGYETMRITEAAQKVQRSGFPEAYEDHAPDARALSSALTGYSPGGAFTCVVDEPEGSGRAQAVSKSLDEAFGTTAVDRTGAREDLLIPVANGKVGNRLGWAIAQYLVAFAGPLKIQEVSFDGRTWRTGRNSEKGWTGSNAIDSRVEVNLG
ncbi:hypothetical protein EFK50_12775 [Nocardioides marmoriginsengisoli]|uniref:Heavy metal transporter n=1 Tax=Nocardioides marmoriginsengisoli TaxID=661483 RepID=A0A3N0CIW3_9ACTN|nr:hypothetical protein EFK50_12775 [Nocardioides marmoriginsengisoli]